MKHDFSRYGVVSPSRPFLFTGLLFALRLERKHKESPVTKPPADGSSYNVYMNYIHVALCYL